MVTADLGADPRAVSKAMIEEGWGSLISVPLLGRGKVLGTMTVGSKKKGEFTPEDARFFSTVASEVGLAIENAQVMARMEQLALTDELTGLYNRRHFHERLNEEIPRAKRYDEAFALIMTDIDNLKTQNDTQGHLFGDQILRRAAAAARAAVRESDVAFRYGGDEFIFILPRTSAGEAQIVAQRIQARMAQEFRDLKPGLSLSMGIAAFPTDATLPEELVTAADAALYQAKRAGGNQVCVFGPRRS